MALTQTYPHGRIDHTAVNNTRYGCTIYHCIEPTDLDNSDQGLIAINQKGANHFQKIKNMFKRRINRFRTVMNSGVPIYLVRFEYEGINYSQAEELYTLLNETYPLGNFFLVCIDEYYRKGINDWISPHERIFHFYVNPTINRPVTASSVDHPNEHFTRIFSELGLLKGRDKQRLHFQNEAFLKGDESFECLD